MTGLYSQRCPMLKKGRQGAHATRLEIQKELFEKQMWELHENTNKRGLCFLGSACRWSCSANYAKCQDVASSLQIRKRDVWENTGRMPVTLNFQSSFKGSCKKDVRTSGEISATCAKETFNRRKLSLLLLVSPGDSSKLNWNLHSYRRGHFTWKNRQLRFG